MKKTIYFLSILTFLLLFLYGCPQSYTEENFIETKTTQLRSNLIGITGESAAEPYIEVEYTLVENGKNVTKTEWLDPPCIVGGNYVLVSYDSINFMGNGKDIISKLRRINPNYNKDGSHYLKIVNHSEKAIEYFVVGTQPLTFEEKANVDGIIIKDGYDLSRFIANNPVPIYEEAPIYYLLFPDKRPQTDCFVRRVTKWKESSGLVALNEIIAKRIKFSNNNCGDIQLTNAWTIEQIMVLYRDEYSNSTNTIMYMDYDDASPPSQQRLSQLDSNNEYIGGRKLKLYGKIAGGKQLQNNGEMWIINTLYPFSNSDF